jgi:uncharacterized protein (DUF2132 family)
MPTDPDRKPSPGKPEAGHAPSPPVHPRDPLQGITLENILNQLVQRHGWSEMGRRIPIRCFQFNPTVKSSLTFLRKTPWARKKVEAWFIGELLPPGNS